MGVCSGARAGCHRLMMTTPFRDGCCHPTLSSYRSSILFMNTGRRRVSTAPPDVTFERSRCGHSRRRERGREGKEAATDGPSSSSSPRPPPPLSPAVPLPLPALPALPCPAVAVPLPCFHASRSAPAPPSFDTPSQQLPPVELCSSPPIALHSLILVTLLLPLAPFASTAPHSRSLPEPRHSTGHRWVERIGSLWPRSLHRSLSVSLALLAMQWTSAAAATASARPSSSSSSPSPSTSSLRSHAMSTATFSGGWRRSGWYRNWLADVATYPLLGAVIFGGCVLTATIIRSQRSTPTHHPQARHP